MLSSGAGAMVPPPQQQHEESENTNINRDAVLKEGILEKESNGIVSWKRKFCVLTRDTLVIYKKGSRQEQLDGESNKNVLYRVQLEDITSISNIEKGRSHIHFAIATKDAGSVDLRVGINQRDWITQIQLAVSARRSRNSFMSELKRKTSQVTHKYRKHGCKRLSFHKDPDYGDGIGITIRNEDDVITVARLFSDGPAYKAGTLRSGDQIVEVNGQQVGGKHAESVAEIIKSVPDHVIMYIKPCSVDRATEKFYRELDQANDLQESTSLSLGAMPQKYQIGQLLAMGQPQVMRKRDPGSAGWWKWGKRKWGRRRDTLSQWRIKLGTNTSAADFAMNRYMNRGVHDRIDPSHLSVEVPMRPRSMGDILDLDDDIGAVPVYSLRDARRMKGRKDSKKRGRHKKDKDTIKQNRMSLPMM